MAYFPFITDIENMDCLIAGGGSVALHKAEILSEYNVNIHIVAISACDSLLNLARNNKRIEIRLRRFEDNDINGMDFVVAATGDRELGLHIAGICRKQRIPVNVVDIKEACSFIFPAIIHKEPLLVAVSSGGASPALAAGIKRDIKRLIPDYYDKLAKNLDKSREYVISNTKDATAATRKQIFEKLVIYGRENKGEIPENIVKDIIEECLEQS
ncbi:MAG: bifunctional precorrin-2 dehydrogenase/sirohydrochlorin ferrochelatase [Lachnospiraceae bacterium]|nr:bifunctional precorrin-2 dehydrogenase/sirohydrochlorin ferrochelatase [Lachnospiraceae bacterium]